MAQGILVPNSPGLGGGVTPIVQKRALKPAGGLKSFPTAVTPVLIDRSKQPLNRQTLMIGPTAPGQQMPARIKTPGARHKKPVRNPYYKKPTKPKLLPIENVARSTKHAGNLSAKDKAAPKGRLDFKALSKSWNAAGKPGAWIDWVKKASK